MIAARQPEMRFVMPKTKDQQVKTFAFRSRERLVHQRTELVNALRAVFYESGHAFPIGIAHLKRMEAVVEEPGNDLPELVIDECRDLLAQIAEKTERIVAKTMTLMALAVQTETARLLQTMPGVVPLTALAVEAFAPDMAEFKSGRNLWRGWGLSRARTPPEARRGWCVYRKLARAISGAC